MIRLKKDTWVLVADGEKALFLVNEGDADDPMLNVRRKTEQDNPPTRDQAANRPGRFNDGPGVQRSAVDDTDWHEIAKERFAKDLAEMLYKSAHAGDFDALVLVGGPQVLGDLRSELHQEVADKVIAEVPKVLTNHPIDDIERLVTEALAATA